MPIRIFGVRRALDRGCQQVGNHCYVKYTYLQIFFNKYNYTTCQLQSIVVQAIISDASPFNFTIFNRIDQLKCPRRALKLQRGSVIKKIVCLWWCLIQSNRLNQIKPGDINCRKSTVQRGGNASGDWVTRFVSMTMAEIHEEKRGCRGRNASAKSQRSVTKPRTLW